MNRHARRGVAAKNKRMVASITGATDDLQAFMTQIQGLQDQLANAADLVTQTRLENEALMSALSNQQAVYYRLFAQGMGVSLDTVMSMVEGIQAQLTQDKATDGIENVRPANPEVDNDPSA